MDLPELGDFVPNRRHPIWNLAYLVVICSTMLISLALITKEWDGEIWVMVSAAAATTAAVVHNWIRYLPPPPPPSGPSPGV